MAQNEWTFHLDILFEMKPSVKGRKINSLLRFEFLGKENRMEYGDFAIPKKLKFSKSLSLKC